MPGPEIPLYDLVVIGGGVGGLACAGLAQRNGLKVALLESHTRLGGCAGYFDRGPYTFDAGATALMGVAPGEPIGDLFTLLGVDFKAVRTPEYRVHMPDRTLSVTNDADAFEQAIQAAFPGRTEARRLFWRLQAAVGTTLFHAANGVPRLPVRSIADLIHDFKILGLKGMAAASTCCLSVLDVLRLLNLDDDIPFRSFIAMLLQDTAQAGPETVPFANASACLQAYRMGMSRPLGGMAALADGLGHQLAVMGGDLRVGTLVDRVVDHPDGGFVVETRRRAKLHTRQVAFNLPLDRAAILLGRSLEGTLARKELNSRAAWSAVTGYVAIRREAVPDDSPFFHQVLRSYDKPIHDGNNVLVSLSTPEDPGYGPPDVRIATMSTHTRPADWLDLDEVGHHALKEDYQTRLLDALKRALPDAPQALVHAEFATPRSFQRYTRRNGGLVGGPPVGRHNSNFLAVGSDVFGAGLWVVGDSVFPGQGTMATVLCGIRVVERITGRSWSAMKATTSEIPRSNTGLPGYHQKAV
jgi:C-3',4' desaturase CrtD